MLFKQLPTTIIKEVLRKIEKTIIGGIKSLWLQLAAAEEAV
jgi:hypothetical protein